MSISEKPIIFKFEMVKAILEDRKTMTRRTKGLEKMNKYPYCWNVVSTKIIDGCYSVLFSGALMGTTWVKCPYQTGDRLWVRETFWKDKREFDCVIYEEDPRRYKYKHHPDSPLSCHDDFFKTPVSLEDARRTVENHKFWKKCPSIHMPRWASRITLEVTNRRIESLGKITEKDAIKEGCIAQIANSKYFHRSASGAFRILWDSINGGKYPYSHDPYVWCISFKRITPPDERRASP